MNIFRRLERLVIMMAMFFAQRVILGKTEFDAVPKEMVPAEFGGTKE